MKYENLDLELFRLNEAGEPLALPWIEQEHLLIRKLEPIADTHRDPKIGFKLMLSRITAFRMIYILSFNPAEHLTGENALFAGWQKPNYEGLRPPDCINKRGDALCFHSPQNGWSGYPATDKPSFTQYWPQTLSHFINDCSRAGIHLVWTPYAVKSLTDYTPPK